MSAPISTEISEFDLLLRRRTNDTNESLELDVQATRKAVEEAIQRDGPQVDVLGAEAEVSKTCVDGVSEMSMSPSIDDGIAANEVKSQDDALIASSGRAGHNSQLPPHLDAEPATIDVDKQLVGQRAPTLIALGSNVGDRLACIEEACRALDAEPDIRIVRTSSLYETKAMYVEDQAPFLNGVCEVSSTPELGPLLC